MAYDVDAKTAEEARTKLHAFLATNPSTEKAQAARQILGKLPAPNMGKPQEHSDAELGLENEIGADPDGQADKDRAAVARTATPIKPQTELEGDPMAQEILSQAMTMPILHGIGLAFSKPANAILNSRGGRAATLLKETEASGGDPGVIDRDAIVQSGSMKGSKVGDALDHLQRLKANGADVERELEQIMTDAHVGSPDVEAARAALKFHPPSPYEAMHAAHSPAAAAASAMHVLPPIMGRLTVPAKIAAATGAGIAHPVSELMANPLMQIVMGQNIFPDQPSPVANVPSQIPGGKP